MRLPRALAFLLAIVVLTVVPAFGQPKEVVIGLLYPLSGPTASAGIDEKHVYELFADMVIDPKFEQTGKDSEGYSSRAGSTTRCGPSTWRPRT